MTTVSLMLMELESLILSHLPSPPAPFRVTDSPIASAKSTGAAAIAVVDIGHDNDNDDTILDQYMDCPIDHGGEQ